MIFAIISVSFLYLLRFSSLIRHSLLCCGQKSVSLNSLPHLNAHSYRENQQDLFNAMGSMYVAVLFIGITNASAVQPVVSVERYVSYRERAAGMYSALPFAFAQVCFCVLPFPHFFISAMIPYSKLH